MVMLLIPRRAFTSVVISLDHSTHSWIATLFVLFTTAVHILASLPIVLVQNVELRTAAHKAFRSIFALVRAPRLVGILVQVGAEIPHARPSVMIQMKVIRASTLKRTDGVHTFV